MNARGRVEGALAGRPLERPLFCPAIYEHKARLINTSVSEVSRSAGFLSRAIEAEYALYRADMLTVGVDVYNIEAEALGGRVTFPDDPEGVPTIAEPILAHPDEVSKLRQVNPAAAGRMPLLLEAAERVQEQLGDEVPVRGAISGPYSIAAGLLGMEPLMMALLENPEAVERLLDFCTQTALRFGRAFLERNVQVCIFDSHAAPPLVSPETYRHIVLPYVKRLVVGLRTTRATFIEYVVGGDTTAIAGDLMKTGADIILSDYSSEAWVFLEPTEKMHILVRRNISPVVIETGTEEELLQQVRGVKILVADHPNCIIGTGVISTQTDLKRVQRLRELCLAD